MSNNKKQNKMEKLIARIQELENKRDAGVMTMDEETLFFRLVEVAEKFLNQ